MHDSYFCPHCQKPLTNLPPDQQLIYTSGACPYCGKPLHASEPAASASSPYGPYFETIGPDHAPPSLPTSARSQPTIRPRRRTLTLIALAGVIALVACSSLFILASQPPPRSIASEITATPYPSDTAIMTPAATSTHPPTSTAAPGMPTSTPYPTYTPYPKPTSTPTPGPTATPRPILTMQDPQGNDASQSPAGSFYQTTVDSGAIPVIERQNVYITGSLTWHAASIQSVVINSYYCYATQGNACNAGEPESDDLPIMCSIDGNTYQPCTMTSRTTKDVNQYWRRVTWTVHAPATTNYLEIQFPDDTSGTFGPCIGEVDINYQP